MNRFDTNNFGTVFLLFWNTVHLRFNWINNRFKNCKRLGDTYFGLCMQELIIFLKWWVTMCYVSNICSLPLSPLPPTPSHTAQWEAKNSCQLSRRESFTADSRKNCIPIFIYINIYKFGPLFEYGFPWTLKETNGTVSSIGLSTCIEW